LLGRHAKDVNGRHSPRYAHEADQIEWRFPGFEQRQFRSVRRGLTYSAPIFAHGAHPYGDLPAGFPVPGRRESQRVQTGRCRGAPMGGRKTARVRLMISLHQGNALCYEVKRKIWNFFFFYEMRRIDYLNGTIART
jgi:hypothetical protein